MILVSKRGRHRKTNGSTSTKKLREQWRIASAKYHKKNRDRICEKANKKYRERLK